MRRDILQLFAKARRRAVQELQLPLVALAPDANHIVQAHSQARREGWRLLECHRGETGHLRTGGSVIPDPRHPVSLEGFDELHVVLPNQFVSRQRRKAIRARCSITHKLLSDMLSTRQISLLSTPSTSRRVKTVETFFGSLFEQS